MFNLKLSKEKLTTLAIGILTIIIFWGDVVFGFHFLFDMDIHSEFLPLQKFLQFSFSNGGQGWWNPYSALGAPVLADGHANNYYIPTMIFRFLDGGYRQLGLLWGLHLLYCFYFLRKLSSQMGLEFRYSFFPPIIFTFCGYLTAVNSNFPYALGITHTPALFYLLLKISSKDRKDYAFFFGVLFSQFFMSGYFPFIFNTIVALMIFFLFSASREDYRRWLPNLCISAITAILFSLPQLLPTIELISESVFNTGMKYDHMISNSLSPRLLLSYLFPSFWGLNDPLNYSYSDNFTDRIQGYFDYDELHNYIGILPLFFAFLSLKNSRKSKYSRALLALGISTFLLSLGGYAPFVYKPLSQISGFNYFKDPSKWSIHLNFCLSLLAGFGLQGYFNEKKDLKTTILHFFLLCTPIFVGLTFLLVPELTSLKKHLLSVHSFPSCRLDDISIFLCNIFDTVSPFKQTILVTVGSLLVLSLPISSVKKSLGIIIFVFIELLLIESPVILRTTHAFFQEPAHIKELKRLSSSFRSINGVIPNESEALSFGFLNGDIGAYYQIHTLTINSPFVTKARGHLEEWTNRRGMVEFHRFSSEESLVELTPLLASFNVGQILSQDYSISHIPAPLPRAYVSYSEVIVKEKDQLDHFLESCKSGKCLEAVISEKSNHPQRKLPLTPAKISFVSTEEVEIYAEAVDQGVLVYTDHFYPGWRVTVNGVPSKILLINGLFKGVRIDGPGRHKIAFYFDPFLYVWTSRWFWICWLFVLPLVFLARMHYANYNHGRGQG